MQNSFTIEHEITFTFMRESLQEAVEVVWPDDGLLEIAGVGFIFGGVARVTSVIHFYAADSDLASSTRLKCRCIDQVVIAVRDTKRRLDGLKYERQGKKLKGERALEELRVLGPVFPLAKQRLKTTFWNGKESFVMALDIVVPVAMNEPKITGEPRYYLEIESKSSRILDEINESSILHGLRRSGLQAIRASNAKLNVAARGGGSGDLAAFKSAEEFALYIQSAVLVAFPSQSLLAIDDHRFSDDFETLS